MFWLVAGYLFMFIFRPWEYWTVLAEYRVERLYMIVLIIAVLFWKEKRYIAHSVNRTVLLFFFAIVICAVTALNWDDAYNKAYDYFKLLVFYYIIILTMRGEKDLKNFIVAYIAIMFLYVEKSAWEFFVNGRAEYRMGIGRMIGIDTTYNDANAFAASMVYSLPFVWALFKSRFENKWVRRLIIVYAALAGTSIIFTGSRSGMVTALLFFLLCWLGGSKKLVGVLVLTFSLMVTWNLMPEKQQDRFMTTFMSKEEADTTGAYGSAQGRILTFKMGIRMFEDYPLTGVGPGNYKKAIGRYIPDFELNAHNMYGMLLGELGLVGTVSFSIMLLTIVACHRRNQKALAEQEGGDPFFGYVSTACLQTIVLLLFNGNFGGNLYRYNWLWIGAIGVLIAHFIDEKRAVPVYHFIREQLPTRDVRRVEAMGHNQHV